MQQNEGVSPDFFFIFLLLEMVLRTKKKLGSKDSTFWPPYSPLLLKVLIFFLHSTYPLSPYNILTNLLLVFLVLFYLTYFKNIYLGTFIFWGCMILKNIGLKHYIYKNTGQIVKKILGTISKYFWYIPSTNNITYISKS